MCLRELCIVGELALFLPRHSVFNLCSPTLSKYFFIAVINSQIGSLITLLTCHFPLELCFIKINSYMGKKEYRQTRHIPSMINKELMTMVGRNKIASLEDN